MNLQSSSSQRFSLKKKSCGSRRGMWQRPWEPEMARPWLAPHNPSLSSAAPAPGATGCHKALLSGSVSAQASKPQNCAVRAHPRCQGWKGTPYSGGHVSPGAWGPGGWVSLCFSEDLFWTRSHTEEVSSSSKGLGLVRAGVQVQTSLSHNPWVT